ncbi:MAG: hypothetical protein IT427_07750 [Pirellulales bacterium]|nr:hypothetical protein [Pirellulales bacterium]
MTQYSGQGPASGKLQTNKSEDRRVEAGLRRARFLVNTARINEAIQILTDLMGEYPGRADIHGTIAWTNMRDDNLVDARIHYHRAHELGCRDRDTYWHWSSMEAANDEWNASAKAAQFGLVKFPGEQGLLFRLGYALHRQGKELFYEENSEKGTTNCQQAQQVLEKALTTRNAEDRNIAIRGQIYRAIVLNLEILDDGRMLSRYFAEWSRECPSDPNRIPDLDRLRPKYPQFLREH